MNKKEIEQALRDYNWMIKEIKRQRELLGHIGTNIVAQSEARIFNAESARGY